MSFGSARQSDRWTAERPPQPDPHLDSWAARPQEPWAGDPGPKKGRKGVAGGRDPLGLISQKRGVAFKNWATPRWGKRPRQATGPQPPPDPSPYLRPFTPRPRPVRPPSPDLERKPGGGALERPERTSCPRLRPQYVGHGPSPGPTPRRPHTLCAKLTDSGRPDRRSTLAAAITRLWGLCRPLRAL